MNFTQYIHFLKKTSPAVYRGSKSSIVYSFNEVFTLYSIVLKEVVSFNDTMDYCVLYATNTSADIRTNCGRNPMMWRKKVMR